jgi:predicted amidohydrolase
MKVAAVQHDIVWEDAAATRSHVEPLLDQARAQGARVALLTEMFATGFSMNPERISEPLDGPTSQWLVTQAARTGMWVGGSIPTRYPGGGPDARPRNTFHLVAPDGRIHRYDKLHPFSYGGEDQHYEAGDSRLVLTIDGVRCALFVCYDLRFGNAMWDLAPDVDCYFFVANWPDARREPWMALLRARAIENLAYVVGVNRVGEGGGLTYTGDSRILDPLGQELVSGSRTEAVLVADIDPEQVAGARARFGFLADRRTF